LSADEVGLVALRSERETWSRVEAERDMAQTETSNWRTEAVKAQARLSDTEARTAHLDLRIKKLKRELCEQRSERTTRLIEQLELQFEDLVTSATQGC
jgi:hypothetical protein